MWNVDFSMILKSFTLDRINQLEVALLVALDFSVRVTARSYASYYFKLHAMRGDKGVAADTEGALDMEGAKELEAISKTYEFRTQEELLPKDHRERSHTDWDPVAKSNPASLEQIVTMGKVKSKEETVAV